MASGPLGWDEMLGLPAGRGRRPQRGAGEPVKSLKRGPWGLGLWFRARTTDSFGCRVPPRGRHLHLKEVAVEWIRDPVAGPDVHRDVVAACTHAGAEAERCVDQGPVRDDNI